MIPRVDLICVSEDDVSLFTVCRCFQSKRIPKTHTLARLLKLTLTLIGSLVKAKPSRAEDGWMDEGGLDGGTFE